jgi:hypothetical protein
VDLSFAFIEGIAEVLKEGGVAGIIVSNRFMTTKAGSQVRERILSRFEVLHVWDFGDTKLFEAAVLPAVLLVRKRHSIPATNPRFTSIYSTSEPPVHQASTVYEALSNGSGSVSVSGTTFLVQHGLLNHGAAINGTWRIATERGDAWLDTVLANTFCTFGEIGKIRVGVKTTADKVFVRKDWDTLPEDMQPELLRPLITHHVARRFKSLPADRQILYTHEDREGKKAAIDLSNHPRSRSYLESHRATLEARTYVIESGRQWYEIWVPQLPSLWPVPKLVFPDISERPTFWMSLDGEVINGDCYWLAAQDRTRIPDLVPIRYGRMSASPFTFLRGSAAVMARDIAAQPTTGIRVQCCGDCHLLNFGAYATPERNLVFDVNDFDETLEAPF